MGQGKQRSKQRKTNTARKSQPKAKRQLTPSSPKPRAADMSHLMKNEQILAMQQQFGNRAVSKMLGGGDGNVVQRDGRLDARGMIGTAIQREGEGKGGEVHEYDAATYAEKSELAKKLAAGLGRVMDADYEAMIQDVKGLKAIDVTAKVDRYLEAAFNRENRMYHDYIGKENLPLVMEQINKVPGLYEKLGLLLAMEPHHGKRIGSYLGIPPLKGFDYKITTTAAGGGKNLSDTSPLSVGGQALKVDLVCEQEGRELWNQTYLLGAIGLSVGADMKLPVSVSYAEGSFDTLVYWGPRDFEGRVDMGTATAAGPLGGYSFGVGTFHGTGSKGSLTIDLSGEVVSSGEIGISVLFGDMVMLGTGGRSGSPKMATMEDVPKIKVTEEIDKEMVITFPAKSADNMGKSFKRDFLELLAKALQAERLYATITGQAAYDKKYNKRLMKKRIKNTRKLINDVVKEKGIDPERVQIEEIENIPSGDKGKGKDPPRDRVTRVKLKGTITVREK